MAGIRQYLVLVLCIVSAALIPAEKGPEIIKENAHEAVEEKPLEKQAESVTVQPEVAPEDDSSEGQQHANGSICAYCSYCKFCKLCDKDCPCTKSKTKPNCHMCKYCKYCKLCSAVCETVCLPGGFLDTVSSAIWNTLPKFDSKMKKAVDKDIDSVKEWIKEYL